MGLNWAEHTVEIDAPIETCFEAIIDYETFPKWQSAVVDTEVLDWDSKGRGKRVRLFIDAKVRKVDYTLDYSYDEPERIELGLRRGERHQRRRRRITCSRTSVAIGPARPTSSGSRSASRCPARSPGGRTRRP